MKCYILPTHLILLYTKLVLFFVISKIFFTKSAATFGRTLVQPILICPRRESYLIYPLSFAMIHYMLLSKLPSLTRFSSQPFASHWCTKKITFLYFWQCFYNKWLISQRFFTSIDCVAYTGQSNILTNPFSYESIVVQRTHNTFTKSSRCAGITTFLISAKSHSWLIVNYTTYL